MAHTLVVNPIHIVFSTKYREPLILPAIEEGLFAYMAGVCQKLNCTPVKIGGYRDHIHILCFLSKNLALAKLMETVKSASSKWVKQQDPRLKNFAWQVGYGAFAVRLSELDKVESYIENQKAHHATLDFKNELLGILKEFNVDYDPRYIWD